MNDLSGRNSPQGVDAATPQWDACVKCSVGVMDSTNPHARGECNCPCHAPAAARTHRERVDDVNRIKGLLYEGSLPWDEQSPNALMVTGGTQGGVYFIGRENFTAAGELMGTAPLSSAEIVKKIDAEKVRRGN